MRYDRITKKSGSKNIVDSIMGDDSNDKLGKRILRALIPAIIDGTLSLGIDFLENLKTKDYKTIDYLPKRKRAVVGINGITKIEFSSANEAQQCLNRLKRNIKDYGFTTVNEYYELADNDEITSSADDEIGWEDLSEAKIYKNGPYTFTVGLPKPKRL